MEKTTMVDYLPDSLEELELGVNFNSPLNNLPSSLKILRLSYKYDKNRLNDSPKNVEVIYY